MARFCAHSAPHVRMPVLVKWLRKESCFEELARLTRARSLAFVFIHQSSSAGVYVCVCVCSRTTVKQCKLARLLKPKNEVIKTKPSKASPFDIRPRRSLARTHSAVLAFGYDKVEKTGGNGQRLMTTTKWNARLGPVNALHETLGQGPCESVCVFVC